MTDVSVGIFEIAHYPVQIEMFPVKQNIGGRDDFFVFVAKSGFFLQKRNILFRKRLSSEFYLGKHLLAEFRHKVGLESAVVNSI